MDLYQAQEHSTGTLPALQGGQKVRLKLEHTGDPDMRSVKFQATVSGKDFGYVYVLSYPGSDKLKIGHSLDPFDRAKDIGGTKAPENPLVEAFFWCSERREDVERSAHRLERDTRHNGEWFTVSIGQAINVIRKAADDVGVEVQLVYDRNEYEKQAAAEEVAAQMADADAKCLLELREIAARQDARISAKAAAERLKLNRWSGHSSS